MFGTRLQRYEEAIAEWKGLIDREPETAGLYVLLAEVYLKTGQYGEAIAACKDAIRLKPEHPQAHYDLGEAYLRKGDIDPAVIAALMLLAALADWPTVLPFDSQPDLRGPPVLGPGDGGELVYEENVMWARLRGPPI